MGDERFELIISHREIEEFIAPKGSQQPRRRGRTSKTATVFQVLWKAEAAGRIAKGMSQGKLIGLVQECLGNDKPSEDAIRKYVKMWIILQKNGKVVPDLSLPADDLAWFEKHAKSCIDAFRKYSEAVKHLKPETGVEVPYPSPLRGKVGNQSGLEEVINPPVYSKDIFKKLRRLERELLDFLPSDPS